ncbi:MAG TPA: HEAT repeat domain-containing protein [Planctomycetota bacterium]|nr:HEAT repeat domain-containing protein [Planctomycetota bacterium]
MTPPTLRRLLRAGALVGAVALTLPACQGTRGAGGRAEADPNAPPARTGSMPTGAGVSGMTAHQIQERDQRFFRVDALVSQWDAAQTDGRESDALALAAKIADETDADYAVFTMAARGEVTVAAQHLAVKALGFSRNPQSTAILVERLQSDDMPLVGNALIALKLRSDPNTSLPPIVRLLRSNAKEARRYAPLAFANAVLARERVGRTVETTIAREAMTGLVGLVQDRDPFVRLHAAKAMGALRSPDGVDFLVLLLKDEHVKIRIAAAAGLERIGDARAFPQVIALLDAVDADQKPLVRDLLISYGERLTGKPMTDAEKAALDTSPRAWDRWYAERDATPPPARAPR